MQEAIICLQSIKDNRERVVEERQEARDALIKCYESMGDVSQAIRMLEEAANEERVDVRRSKWLFRAASIAYRAGCVSWLKN